MDSSHVRSRTPASAGNDSSNQLVLGHLALARSLARRVWLPTQSILGVDDLEQEAMLALVEAARRFDESRGVKFATFAFSHIRGRLLKRCGSEQRHYEQITHYSTDESDDDRNDDPLDIVDPDAYAATDMRAHIQDRAELLLSRVNGLPAMRRAVMTKLLQGQTTTEVACDLRISVPRVSTIARRCTEQLVEEIAA